jgi:transcriptional regulator with PAS, ATPase and Fis domain
VIRWPADCTEASGLYRGQRIVPRPADAVNNKKKRTLGNSYYLTVMDFSVFDQLLEGVQVISDDIRYVYLNDSVKAQGGILNRDVVGLKCEEVYPGIEQSNAFINIRECLRTNQPINFMNQFNFPDGSVGYFELRMNRIKEGVLVFSVDRTDEMKKEIQVQETNKRYETITESVQSAMFEWDSEGNIIFR